MYESPHGEWVLVIEVDEFLVTTNQMSAGMRSGKTASGVSAS